MNWKKLKPKKATHGGCLNCPPSEEILSMNTELYSSFGGWHINKNKKLYYVAKSENSCKKLKSIERDAKKYPDNNWMAYFNSPLRTAEYQRHDLGKWVLVKTGMGFA